MLIQTTDHPDFYSIKKIMFLLDIRSRTTIYDMVKRGDFEMVSFRGNSRITRASYEAWKETLERAKPAPKRVT